MKQTQILMGMPITVELIDGKNQEETIRQVYEYFEYIDQTFSTYKPESEISLINKGKISKEKCSQDMKTILRLSDETKKETMGYFNILHNGTLDPSGIVKGWSIFEAAKLLTNANVNKFYIEAGGDIQVSGTNSSQKKWRIGIRNPFNDKEIVKVVYLTHEGIATSGTYVRGQHIYDPFRPELQLNEVVSVSVIGPNIYDADRFATAAFAMGKVGIEFIEGLIGFEGYQIDKNGIAKMTSNFSQYLK